MLVRSNALDVVVIDSVAALVPRAELEGEMGDSHVGLQARLMSQALRKLTAIVAKSKTTLVFINQIREKIGVMFGSPETTTGGRALKFYSSVRIDIRRIASLKEGEEVIGSRAKVKVVKNKVAAPFRQAEFDILYTEGISLRGELIDLGVLHKLVTKSGAWYAYGDVRLGQGRENAMAFLKDNPDLQHELETRLREAMGLRPAPGRSRCREPPVSRGAWSRESVVAGHSVVMRRRAQAATQRLVCAHAAAYVSALLVAQRHQRRSPTPRFGRGVAEAAHARIALEHLAHDLALHADAAAVDDAQLAQTLLPGGVEVVAHHVGHLLGQEGVEVERVGDRDLDRLGLVAVVLVVDRARAPSAAEPAQRSERERRHVGDEQNADRHHDDERHRARARLPISGLPNRYDE